MGGKGLDCIASFASIVGLEKCIDNWTPVNTAGIGDILLVVVFEVVTVIDADVDVSGRESESGRESVRIVQSENRSYVLGGY